MSQVLQLPVPEPGQLVDVRRRRYVVMDIAQSPLPPDILTSGSLLLQRQHLVTLSSVEDDALGLAMESRQGVSIAGDSDYTDEPSGAEFVGNTREFAK